ncbi:MAG TPA: ABC transporter substrate-binding protein [Castellaniella sp.]|uniref:ABC transporter substrate-binding protein n=1 Tax=Castellaniella sp. TaxID=1955812 RepID=UPI002EDC8966
MKKQLVHFAAGVTAALFCAGLVSPASAADIKIGVLVPLTGTNAIQGKDISQGIQLAIDQINQGHDIPMKGGSAVKVDPKVLGGTIKLVIEDTESRPASALDAMRKLVNVDKVPVVLGILSSGVCVPTGQFAQKSKVVEICSSSTSPELRKIGPYLFSAMGLDDLMGKAIADFAHEDSGAKTYGSLAANNPFGVGMEIQSCNELKSKDGADCVTKVRYEEGKSDYNADLRRTVSQKPGAVLFTAYGADARLMLQEAYQLGIQVSQNWYADYPSLWVTDIQKSPQVGEGIKGLEPGAAGPAYDAYTADFTKKFGAGPTTVFSSYAYDSAMLVALAIQKAKASNADAIRDALIPVSQNYAGVTGSKAFDKDGMQKSESYRRVIVKDGKMVPYVKK